MAYTKVNFVDGATPLNKANLGNMDDYIATLDSAVIAGKGQPNGYASLDSGGKVPAAQLPTSGSGAGSPPTRTVLTASSGTYTTPAGCRAIFVECIGGGGGAGGSAATGAGQCSASGGAGGGAYAAKLISPPAASYSYAVGAGGTAGAAGNFDGGVGGDTSFGSGPLVLAKGGDQSAGCPVVTPPYCTDRGATGGRQAQCIGDITMGGGPGTPSLALSATNPGVGGNGGNAARGGGGGWGGRVAAGAGGQAPGGGGGGASATQNAAAMSGSAGAAGLIVVFEYY